MSALRGLLIAGAMVGLTAVASAAPAEGKARKARKAHHRPFVEGVVTAVHHQPGGKDGTLTIRLGGRHHRHQGRTARKPMHHQHRHRTETFAVNNGTKFEKVVGNSQRQVHFHDVHKGDHVKILRHKRGENLARLVDILGGSGRHRGRGVGRGGPAGTTSVHRPHKRPLRHTLVEVRKVVRYLARHPEARRDLRQAVRREARRLLSPQTRRAVARHPLTAARKAGRVVRRQVLPQVQRLVEGAAPVPKAGQAPAKVTAHVAKVVPPRPVAPKPAPAHVASHPVVAHHAAPAAHHAAPAHRAASAHHAASGHRRR
jgi:hypothetical protein